MDTPTRTPEPWRVRAGAAGGRARWDADAERRGLPPGPRELRLDTLSPRQRRLVLALRDANTAALRAVEIALRDATDAEPAPGTE